MHEYKIAIYTLFRTASGELLYCAVLVTSTYFYICLGSCAPCALHFIPHNELISISLAVYFPLYCVKKNLTYFLVCAVFLSLSNEKYPR